MRAWCALAILLCVSAGCDLVLGFQERPPGPAITNLRVIGEQPVVDEVREVRATIHGAANAPQTYGFSATFGVFVPTVGETVLDENGDAEITSMYVATRPGQDSISAMVGSVSATLTFQVIELVVAGLETGPISIIAGVNVYFGGRINLGQAGELRSIGLETTVGMTTMGKFGLYTDSSGRPGTVIADLSQAQAVQSGKNVFPVPATMVPAGDYWLVAIFDRNTPVASATNASATYGYIAGSFSDPMPATMPSWGTTTNTQLAYFFTVLVN